MLLARIAWSILIAVESIATVALLAIVSGWLPAPPAVQLWTIGVCVAGSLTLALTLPRPGRIALHGALLLGSLVFLLPIGWLISTSFKQPDETFVFPPVWIPGTAEAADRSPWSGPAQQTEDTRWHALRFGRVQLQFDDGSTRDYEPVWSTSYAAAPWENVSPAALDEDGDFVATYHFTDDKDQAVYETEVGLDPANQSEQARPALTSVALRFQSDDSWHGFVFEVEHDGNVYESTDLLSLNGDRWMEWAFELEPGKADQRELGIWPMRSRLGAASPDPQVKVRVNIIERSPFTATLCKWTQSYRDAWYADPLWPRYLFNSVLLVVLNILGQVFACSLAAFAFSRLRWAGRDLVFAAVVSTMMLPAIVMLIPQFLIFRTLGWYNTLLPLWVPALAGAPFFIFIIRQFMLGLPRELDEAARIDGCSWLGVYLRVTLPLSKPALAAVAVFTFMASWNEFMGPLIYLSDARLYPLPLGLYSFRTDYETRFNMLMAASTIMVIPAVAIFFCAQRYFIQGASFAGVNR